MGRRSDIDWEAIERDVIAGVLTYAQIAEKHGVSEGHVKAKTKKEGWQRDLSAAIRARTKVKVSQIDVAELIEQSSDESAEKSAKTIKSAVEQAADIAAGIILKHRSIARRNHERAEAIESILDQMLSSACEIKDIAAISQAFKQLVETRMKLIAVERDSFNLSESTETEQRTEHHDDYVECARRLSFSLALGLKQAQLTSPQQQQP